MKRVYRRCIRWSVPALLALFILGSGESRDAAARDGESPIRLEVTVTNITRGQVFSPPVVATHGRGLQPIFVLGEPASDELSAIAEDAVNEPMVKKLSESPHVHSVQVLVGKNGPLAPGESASVEIEASRVSTRISLAGMLVTTNDAFFALEGEAAPLWGSRSFFSAAYDAGSEANNEECEFIPGPPCGNAGVRAVEGAEGFVHIHAGIHGGADLDPARFDWRNPVAKITVRRLPPARD